MDMELFPAVVIGGPPHSGKSVLAYSLTQALRHKGIAHYVLRAYPDGEGDWANEADQTLVRRIRVKGDATPEWIDRICRDISNRHLPLIVDVGGRPTGWQEAVFDRCTHAVLLTRGERSRRQWWRMLAGHHALPVLADLHSTRTGDDVVLATSPVLKGRISHLERGRAPDGFTLRALVDLLAGLFAYDEAELRTAHQMLAPAELVVELNRMLQTQNSSDEPNCWSPQDLPALLDYLPDCTALAVYDRGPNWLYAAVAVHAYPAPIYQFDVRLGWVAPPELTVSLGWASYLLASHLTDRENHVRLELALPDAYLDYGEAQGISVPELPPARGVIISGKLPLWLWTALGRAYHNAPWIGIFQPQLGDRAVIVASREPTLPIGSHVASKP